MTARIQAPSNSFTIPQLLSIIASAPNINAIQYFPNIEPPNLTDQKSLEE